MTCSVGQVGDREWWCDTHRRDAQDCSAFGLVALPACPLSGCTCMDDPPRVCPTRTPEIHGLGDFPMTCYDCHVEADS